MADQYEHGAICVYVKGVGYRTCGGRRSLSVESESDVGDFLQHGWLAAGGFRTQSRRRRALVYGLLQAIA